MLPTAFMVEKIRAGIGQLPVYGASYYNKPNSHIVLMYFFILRSQKFSIFTQDV
jgi:hypothetical protein